MIEEVNMESNIEYIQMYPWIPFLKELMSYLVMFPIIILRGVVLRLRQCFYRS